ncbi:GTP pyrophosphokinase [Nocardioides lianchengensis]|uniref:Putative GTP pyrophosphokinase n=1 Tax=Nocardioides lianchengensis TaxID=1045774 RepID=A0A1G6ZS57_9ACTN|nr:GTP pyrophosphokinase family protein [Nocardioides lianchengensis]NYG12202.1 putative GTP pyrophosphokinase [Nocardioides lianchengensis]SDE05369.1 putative GTP pyrophosphokinase [Nocardioides lianchengensis]
MTVAPWDDEFRRFLLEHKFGMDEVVTKLNILRDEFTHLHDYNPIEHVSSRLKSPESLVEKIARKGIDLEGPTAYDAVRQKVTDIAGVRVTCSFVSDVYQVFDLLTAQRDVRTVEVRDYIVEPKPNGYRSLHVLVEVPVFLSGGVVPVVVEVQLRTVAMDFWASLEHKIYYKYRREVPGELLAGLRDAADTAYNLDTTMERLHQEVRGLDALPTTVIDKLRASGNAPAEELVDALRRLGAQTPEPPVAG